jgi:NAD(P)-dependent dehydrogenase (short-subunit alcohol dehydrogenase family)/rhamnose utilization protein RhaD (predicted bifunctional aldolase and dehydrogenase)
METKLQNIAQLSQLYGADPAFVFLGGGNTSVKDDKTLYIKPSGVALATIQPEQFLAMERQAIGALFTTPLPEDATGREAAAKAIMDAAVRPLGAGRPSVEAPVHEVIDYSYVVHLHPTLVNGMTCAEKGREACAELFPEALWLDYCDPGCTLAFVVKEALDAVKERDGKQPRLIFLQNHGVFVGADSADEIRRLYGHIMERLSAAYAQAGVAMEEEPLPEASWDSLLANAPALRTLLGTADARAVLHCLGVGEAQGGPLTPDHVVYAKSFAYRGAASAAGLAAFAAEKGYQPKVVEVPGEALFSVGDSLKDARAVAVALANARQVQALTAAFGGAHFLNERQYRFIEEWEVESYRRKVSLAASGAGRLNNRVSVVTGGAQGFGLGIAQHLAAQGALVVIADVNAEGAAAAAKDLCASYGADRASSVAVNIADEESVAAMFAAVTRDFGGVDLLVANAGVLRAGSVKEMTQKDWDFVTNINYTGYFLCVKHAAKVMAAQIVDGKGLWSDVVQVNSKSGLEGSNKNGAYAGSKFGTIGLTQSFAKELVTDCIKVNSVCPGNYYDGPLWSDPERGLFVQYLRTGKVPGAKTVDEVRQFYEEKVPMRRGCMPVDVARAIMYCVEQAYETGQAIPVTGGQVMLH